MKQPVFTGAAVAIITPMHADGTVNFEELGRIIDDQIAHGTDAIVICGTTGESLPLRSPKRPRKPVQMPCCWLPLITTKPARRA